MEFHQLRYFVAAAEDLSISRAAERLHVSQPALSRQIAVLENEIGVPLFDRIKKRIYLTEAGRFFLPKARQILCDAEASAQQLREQFGHVPRTYRVGFITPLLDDVVAPAVRALRAANPRFQVTLLELTPRAQLDRLRDRELDVAVLGNVDDEARHRFEVTQLARYRMAAVLSADHPSAKHKSVALSELAQELWISLSEHAFPGRREFLRVICRKSGFEPDIVLEADGLAVMMASIAAGSGVGILPKHAEKLPHAGAVFVNLQGPPTWAEALAVRNRLTPDLGIEAIVHALGDAAAAE